MRKYKIIIAVAITVLSLAGCKDKIASLVADTKIALPSGALFICQVGGRNVTFYEDRIIDSDHPSDVYPVEEIHLEKRGKTILPKSGRIELHQEFRFADLSLFEPVDRNAARMGSKLEDSKLRRNLLVPQAWILSRQASTAGGFTSYWVILHIRGKPTFLHCDQANYSDKMAELSNFTWAATFDEDYQREEKLRAEKAEADRVAMEEKTRQEAEIRRAEAQERQQAEAQKARENQARREAEMKRQQEAQARKQREAKVKGLFR